MGPRLYRDTMARNRTRTTLFTIGERMSAKNEKTKLRRNFIWLGTGVAALFAPPPANIPLSIIWLSVIFDSLFDELEKPKPPEPPAIGRLPGRLM